MRSTSVPRTGGSQAAVLKPCLTSKSVVGAFPAGLPAHGQAPAARHEAVRHWKRAHHLDSRDGQAAFSLSR